MQVIQINFGCPHISNHRADIQSQSSLMLNPQPMPRFPISKGQWSQSLGCSSTLVQVYLACICPATVAELHYHRRLSLQRTHKFLYYPLHLKGHRLVRANLLSNFLFCLIFMLHHESSNFLGKMCLDEDGQCF